MRRSPAKVTAIVTTYNHVRFIAQALNSVLMQEADFAHDVVVIDDASTDGTRDLLIAYQSAHPDNIRLVLNEANKCDNSEFTKAIVECSSPYIAVLDGDDYWTSPHKLQRQADYLDRHPECAGCFHNVSLVHDDGSQPPRNSNPPDQREISSLEDVMEGCFAETCSTMFRRSALGDFPTWYVDDKSADWSLLALAARHGNIGYLNEVMGVYRQHAGGFWTGQTKVEQQGRVVAFYENILGCVPPAYAGEVRARIARQWLELAVEYDRIGNPRAAESCRRNGFEAAPDIRKLQWTLRSASGFAAELIFPPDQPDTLRVAIHRAGSGQVYDVQLNRQFLAVQANRRYTVRFRARADGPRSLAVGFARDYDPWAGLGFYKEVELTSEWREFTEVFIPAIDEPNGRLHFDIGGSDIPVDLAEFTMQTDPLLSAEQPLPDGRGSVKPDTEPRPSGSGCCSVKGVAAL